MLSGSTASNPLCAHLGDARLHDWGEHVDPADVEPALSRPAVERAAEHRVGKFVLVAAKALPRTRVHVTDDVAAEVVQPLDLMSRRLVGVDVVHGRVHGHVEGLVELPLPLGLDGWRPARTGARSGHGCSQNDERNACESDVHASDFGLCEPF
jgi:hypothetical protein